MTTAVLAAWVLAAMVAQVPPDKAAAAATYPEAQETAQERLQRYEAISEDIAAVVAERAPEGERKRLAALLVAVAIFESGLAKDVDGPQCGATRISRGGCDRGRSVSLWQLQGGPRPKTRQEAARAALAALQRSTLACRKLPPAERLAAYCAGRCSLSAGRRLSRERMALAERLAAR